MMKKRPLSIIIIALIYLFEPVGNLIQAAYINKLPLFGDNSILNHLIWSDWIILGLFPVVALGVYMVRKWGLKPAVEETARGPSRAVPSLPMPWKKDEAFSTTSR